MSANNDFEREISFDIVESMGVITRYSTGWCKELNLVSWNGGAPKYDIRDWAPDHEHMSRGVTLHEKEMRTVLDLVRRRSRRKPGNNMQENDRMMDTAAAEERNVHTEECETDSCVGEQHCMEESA